MDTTTDRVKGAIGDMASRVHQGTDTAAQRVHQATDTAADQARQGTDQAAGVLGTIEEKAHNVAAAVADTACHAKESVLHAKDAFADWASDAYQHPGDLVKAGSAEVTGLIRRYPISAVLVGIGIGFMCARACAAKR